MIIENDEKIKDLWSHGERANLFFDQLLGFSEEDQNFQIWVHDLVFSLDMGIGELITRRHAKLNRQKLSI